jgi:hypothetical protein
MKKLFFALVACVAMLGLTSCSETIESQIFELTYDAGSFESGDIMYYQTKYMPIFDKEIVKVAPRVGEDGYMYMINGTSEKKAKADVQAAFNEAIKQVEEQYAKDNIISLEGFKVIVKHSTPTKREKVDFVTYTFKKK